MHYKWPENLEIPGVYGARHLVTATFAQWQIWPVTDTCRRGGHQGGHQSANGIEWLAAHVTLA